MAKLTWNDFVAKHTNGAGVTITIHSVEFKKLAKVSPKTGMKLPTPAEILKQFLGAVPQKDWAVRVENYPAQNKNTPSVKGFHMIFEEDADALAILRKCGDHLTTKLGPAPSGQPAYRSHAKGPGFRMQQYEAIAINLGY